MSILQILQVERHVPKIVTRYQYPGRKPHDRQCLARAFAAKALYRFPTTSDLRRGLLSVANLRYQYIDRIGDPDLGFDGILVSDRKSWYGDSALSI